MATQVIAHDWVFPPNDSVMTTNGQFPDAIKGLLDTFTINGSCVVCCASAHHCQASLSLSLPLSP